VPFKLPRKQGVVPHGLFVRSHTHAEQTESREKQGNNKLGRTDPPPRRYILLSAVIGGTGELRLTLADGPLGGLSIGQQALVSKLKSDYTISAGSRHRVSTKQPAVNANVRSWSTDTRGWPCAVHDGASGIVHCGGTAWVIGPATGSAGLLLAKCTWTSNLEISAKAPQNGTKPGTPKRGAT
jgi:hypothetical protein